MDKHIPSHLIPFLDEYERQNISEMEEVFSIKQDGMTRAERRAWKRKISKAKLKTNNKVNIITNGFHNSKKTTIMTEELFNRVVEINDKLTQLEIIMKRTEDAVLTYTTTDGKPVAEVNEFPYLTNLLRKHETDIREELRTEIAKIKQQISRL